IVWDLLQQVLIDFEIYFDNALRVRQPRQPDTVYLSRIDSIDSDWRPGRQTCCVGDINVEGNPIFKPARAPSQQKDEQRDEEQAHESQNPDFQLRRANSVFAGHSQSSCFTNLFTYGSFELSSS